jgi:hypothetical protein
MQSQRDKSEQAKNGSGRKVLSESINLSEVEEMKITLTNAGGAPIATVAFSRIAADQPQITFTSIGRDGEAQMGTTLLDVKADSMRARR